SHSDGALTPLPCCRTLLAPWNPGPCWRTCGERGDGRGRGATARTACDGRSAVAGPGRADDLRLLLEVQRRPDQGEVAQALRQVSQERAVRRVDHLGEHADV